MNPSTAGAIQAAATDAGAPKKPVELSPIHDFAAKIRQEDLLPRVREYVRWQALQRGTFKGPRSGTDLTKVPDFAPVSINLDLTTSCNYHCDHCVDLNILNTGIKFQHERLLDSLRLMAERGLKSVIVIGGGEPTVYPRFTEVIRLMKELALRVAVVSNGSGMKRIAEVAEVLEDEDWVRLSLDSGSDEVFQAMHKPKKPISLDQICEGVLAVRRLLPRFKIGFSFIITWKGAFINETNIVENLHEIVPAAERARRSGFDYIAFKPFLTRAEFNNAEIVDLKDTHAEFDRIVERIREQMDVAKKLETPRFRVYETTNLKVLENKSYRNYTNQPEHCHMQFFHQVLSPLGMFNCPVYRNQPHGRLGSKEAYSNEVNYELTRATTAHLIRTFNATEQCKEVTCLYNHVNWWLEDLIEHPEKLDTLEPSELPEPDYFL